MTSTVRVTAHCRADQYVSVILTDEDATTGETKVLEDVLMNDGESIEWLVHDNRCLRISEELKPIQDEQAHPEGERSPELKGPDAPAGTVILPPAA